jgi:hypothetical protein
MLTGRLRLPEQEVAKEQESVRCLYMFLCFSGKLFHTKIELKDNFIDDDQKVFKKMRKSYGKARGLLGKLSLVYSLTGIRHVKVLGIAFYGTDITRSKHIQSAKPTG